jgi:glucose dehydrogenase
MTQRIAATLLLLLSIAPTAQRPTDGDWPMYGRDGGAERHSPLTQINRSNVSTLQQAWSFVGSKIVAFVLA